MEGVGVNHQYKLLGRVHGRRNVFLVGGQRQKKGTIMSKRALTVHMQIISLMC